MRGDKEQRVKRRKAWFWLECCKGGWLDALRVCDRGCARCSQGLGEAQKESRYAWDSKGKRGETFGFLDPTRREIGVVAGGG